MKKLLTILTTLLLSSCSSVIIYSPKTIHVVGDENSPVITGSELDGNTLDQDAEGTIPLVK